MTTLAKTLSVYQETFGRTAIFSPTPGSVTQYMTLHKLCSFSDINLLAV